MLLNFFNIRTRTRTCAASTLYIQVCAIFCNVLCLSSWYKCSVQNYVMWNPCITTANGVWFGFQPISICGSRVHHDASMEYLHFHLNFIELIAIWHYITVWYCMCVCLHAEMRAQNFTLLKTWNERNKTNERTNKIGTVKNTSVSILIDDAQAHDTCVNAVLFYRTI